MMERQNWIPETDESSSDGDESSKKLIDQPWQHFVRKRGDAKEIKVVVIFSDGEQSLYTFDVTDNWTLQDLLNEITAMHKIKFGEGAKYYLETNPDVQFNYLVHVEAERCPKPEKNHEDSDDDGSVNFAVRKRRCARIFSSPGDRRNSPGPPIEISETTDEETERLLKVSPEQPEVSELRKVRERRSTETQLFQDDDWASLPSSVEENQMEEESDDSEAKNKSFVTDTNNNGKTERSLETDTVATNSSSVSSQPLSYTEVIEGGGVLVEIQNTLDRSIQDSNASLICKTVFIGSYYYSPQERLVISQYGMRFSAPLVTDDTVTVPLEVKFADILKLVVHFGEALPLLFFYVRLSAAEGLRDCVGMQDPRALWYNPAGKDATQRTIMLWPVKISEESKIILKTLFSPNGILAEITIEEASAQLLRSSPKSILKQMKGFVKNLEVGTSKSGTLYEKKQDLIKEIRPGTTMDEDLKLDIVDQLIFKKPKNLLEEVKQIKSIKDNLEKSDEIRDVSKNKEYDPISEKRREFRSLFGEDTTRVEDIVNRETKKPVKRNLNLRKKSKLNTSVVDDFVNRKTDTLFKGHQISIKRLDQNTVQDTENRKIGTLSPKPLSPLKRTKATIVADANDSNDPQIVLVYPPPPAKGRISISVSDVYCLREGQFLNDLIIDFYFKYLMHEVLSETDKMRTYIFSVHFYKRLTSPVVSSSSNTLSPSAAQHHANVSNWTKNVNVFEKDFVVVPINRNLHWFLAIICFPGLVGKTKVHPISNDEDGVERSSYRRRRAKEMKLGETAKSGQIGIKKRPCILVFDSLASPEIRYKPVMSTLRDYLSCEHRAKIGSERIFSEKTIRGVCPKVPQQTNFHDCGIYVLQYVESFFKNPIKDYELPIDRLTQWFDEKMVSSKRQKILKLLKTLKNRQ